MLTIDEKIKHLQNLGFDGDLKEIEKMYKGQSFNAYDLEYRKLLELSKEYCMRFTELSGLIAKSSTQQEKIKYENDENVRWITENLPLTPVSLAGILPKQLGGDKGYVQIYPGEYGMDGFFVSAFKKI